MSSSSSTFLAESMLRSQRPRLGHRSISDMSPLVDPSNDPAPKKHQANVLPGLAGTRVRVQNDAVSGAQLKDGTRAPFTPLLPMPPAAGTKDMADLSFLFRGNQDSGNSTPKADTAGSNTLASRRQAKRGASEGICPSCMNTLQACATFGGPSCGSRRPLHVDTKTAAEQHGRLQPPAPRSAGMIRSYSMPVATQQEHEEQNRIMALGVSPVGKYVANPSWWSYGFASPGGAPLNLERRPSMGPAPHERVLAPSRTVAQPSRQRSSPSSSPKGKGALSSPRNLPRSPKASRSPLGSLSLNLAPLEQRGQRRASGAGAGAAATSSPLAAKRAPLRDERSPTRSPASQRGSIDRAIDSLSARLDLCGADGDVDMDEDYFSPRKGSAGTSDAGSEEALTPRASSPNPYARTGSLGLDFGADVVGAGHRHFGSPLKQATAAGVGHGGDDLGELDFIHPDHLQPLPPIDF
ncbi:uncharacterized protein PSFLO_02738 [Pseudozyma flocculosa]|uniref:Uncharacterized protein n=1 Tax=Pseudozyma flocculosa TaxID=84751 RepID=A0A5C3F055_9BASI|nr:uncharacterized protein PSFLO_02738 [Pseudozyma flocculosa]